MVDVRVQQLPVNWAVGQRAEVFVESGHKSGIVAIPQKFLLWREGKPGVFVNDDGRTLWRSITVGLNGQQDIEVTKGLSAGDQILKPSGMRLMVQGLAWPDDKGEWVSLVAGRPLGSGTFRDGRRPFIGTGAGRAGHIR